MADVIQSAGQSETSLCRVTWRSWEPEKATCKSPLMLLHPLPHNGSFFARIAPLLAQDRLVFAPDYPGYGGSWELPGVPTIPLYAQAVREAWQAQEVAGTPDLFGFHTGCLVGPELAWSCPGEVGRMVLVDVPFFEPEKRKEMLKADWAVDGFIAAFSYPAEQRFAEIPVPSLIIATQSRLSEPSKAAAKNLSNSRLLEMPDVTEPAMENGALAISAASLEFLDSQS